MSLPPEETSRQNQGGKSDNNGKLPPKNIFGRLRLRPGSKARYDTDFADDQPWAKLDGTINLEFVNETPNSKKPRMKASVPDSVDENGASPKHIKHTKDFPTTTRDSERAVPQTVDNDDDDFTGSSAVCGEVSMPSMSHVSPSRKRKSWDEVDPMQSGSFYSPQQSLAIQTCRAGEPRFLPYSKGSTEITSKTLPPIAELLGQENFDGVQQRNEDFPGSIRSPASGSSTGELWPSMNVQEACLMRYFIESLAGWFDMCDSDRHFGLVVPQRAKNCPALLNAIYTASARHLSRLDQYRKDNELKYLGNRLPHLQTETAIEYHTRCIEYLSVVSHDPDAVFDENLLAASVILRLYEEIDAPFNGGDWETSLRGTQVFLDAQADTAIRETGLRRACFRVAFRQEVQLACIKQRSLQLPLTYCDSYRSLEPADDYTWAHRIVILCADVLMYCYGEHQRSNHDYDCLLEYHTAWLELRPKSFDPIFIKPASSQVEEIFPEMWFLSDCHVTGVQHFDLSKLLLSVYNPRIPRLGRGHKLAMQRIEKEVVSVVKRLCGTAISNRRAPPAMNTACAAISMFGEQFTDERERKAILEMLEYSDKEHNWPTGDIQERLKESWNLSPE